MDRSTIHYLERDESHLVKATLIINGAEINDVLCKVFLPERTHETPLLVFNPSKGAAHTMMHAFKGAFKAVVYANEDKIQTSFEASEVYFSGARTKYWGEDISETTVKGEPHDLFVINPLRSSEEPRKTNFVFWISPNKFLTANSIRTTSFMGDFGRQKVKSIKFTIQKEIELNF